MKTIKQKEYVKTNRKNFWKRIPWGVIVSCTITLGPIIWFVLWFTTSAIHNSHKPEHTVHIEYMVYDVPGGSKRTGNYKVKGEKFVAVKTSEQGTNKLVIKDADNSGVRVEGQTVVVYVGTSDVQNLGIRVVK